MDYQHIQYEVGERIGTVTFSRPDKMNALTFDSYREFEHLTRTVALDPEIHVLILRGAGAAFCAGGDVHEIIGELLERDMHDTLRFTQMTGAVVRNLREMPQPVIAQVRGAAVGAGAVIACAADMRVLSESARFGFLFTKVGLTGADMGLAYLLPRMVGFGRAMELLLLGDTIDAQECRRIGLANRVVAEDELHTATMTLARRLANGPILAQSVTKRLVQRELDMDFHSALEGETFAQALLLRGDDHAEFYKAWSAKRPPQWKGR